MRRFMPFSETQAYNKEDEQHYETGDFLCLSQVTDYFNIMV